MFDRAKIALVMDHFTPNKDIKSAQQCKAVRDFSAAFGIEHFYDVGRMGIEHALLPEQGLVVCGDVVIGADSAYVYVWRARRVFYGRWLDGYGGRHGDGPVLV